MFISSNEMHLWFCYDEQIQNRELLSQYHLLLNEKERSQHQRFVFEKNRHQYLITRAVVRTVLSQYEQEIRPENWQFKNNEFGKPFIANSSLTVPLSFNISHCENLVVMAVTAGHDIGVDAEYILRPAITLDIANRFFSTEEVAELYSLPSEKRMDRFYDLWTFGEAYIKACGMGLSIPLDQFSCTFPQAGEVAFSFKAERNDLPEFWRFWQVRPTDTHKVSIALKNETMNHAYSIKMRNIIPLFDISEVYHSIVMKTSAASQVNSVLRESR